MANWEGVERWAHQTRGVAGTIEKIEAGEQRICLTSPTGGGKSLMLFDLMCWAAEQRWRVAAYVNRTMLFDQLSENLTGWGIAHGKRAAGHDPDIGHDVQLCMTQTETSKVLKSQRRSLHPAKLVLIDECFVSGTKILTTIGPRPIQNIRPGDVVYCATGIGVVRGTSSRLATDIYKVEFSDGSKLQCTGAHRVFTGRGWRSVRSLAIGEIAHGVQDVSDLWRNVPAEAMDQREGQGVRNSGGLLETPNMLLAELLEEVRKPDGYFGGPPQSQRDHEEAEANAYQARREWAIASLAPASAFARARRRLGVGVCHPDEVAARERIPNVLQGRHRESGEEDCNRDRRRVSQNAGSAAARQEEGGATERTWVVRVSRLKRSSPVVVFNLHIGEHPSYFANGHLVHNCHNQCGETMKRIMQDHIEGGAAVVGVTATPLDLEGIYTSLVQAGVTSELRACGALVPAYTFGPDEPDTRNLKPQKTGEFSQGAVTKVIMTRTIFGRVYEWWKKLNPEARPAILFAPGVKESLWFAQEFEKQGVRAAHIDGEGIYIDGEQLPSNQENRDMLARESRDGRLPVVCNRFVMREGIDWPWLYHGIFATVFGSVTSFIQSGGRLLRAHPSLNHVIIQDHGGCLDEESEVLTKRGWQSVAGILDSDTIGTMNMETGAFEWCENQGTLKKQRDSFMYQLASPHLNLRVTGYHEMVFAGDLRRGKWRKAKASELAIRKSNWIIPTSAIEDVPAAELTDSEIGFIGWFLTDGCMDNARIRIYQAAFAKQKHHDHIEQCLNGCGFRWNCEHRVQPSKFADGVSVCAVYSIQSGRKSRGGWDRLTPWLKKSFPLHAFEKLDRRQFGVLMHAMNLGDGLKHAGYNQKTISLAVAKKDVADRIQSLAVRRGYRCNISRQDQLGDDKRKPSTIYILHIRDSQKATVAARELTDSYIGMDETVWCVQTANGTIVTRRHGKVAIVGNSWWRHGSLNADRHWELGKTALQMAQERFNKLRNKDEPEPILCPKCFRPRLSGKQCPGCGFEHTTKSRPVIQKDGTLRKYTGDIFKPRKVKLESDTEKKWKQVYFRCKNSKRPMTFTQALAVFKEAHGYYPPADIAYMPKHEADTQRRISDVAWKDLIQPKVVAEQTPQPSLFS